MAFRSSIQDFALANNIYIGAVVAFYTVNSSGQATSILAPLYADPTSTTQLPNPQILNSTGKFVAPVYISQPVIGEVQGPSIPTHSTGIINPRGTWRGNWAAATQYYSEDFIQDPATGNLWIAALDYISSGAITTDIGAGNLVLAIDQTPLTTEGANLAIKMPARVATTGGNIVLSGLGTLDGVTLNSGDRVLVKDQTNKTTNGIYVALSGAWALASDFMTSAMLTQGAQVFVTSGAINGLSTWSLATANPIVLGTSNIVFTYGLINDQTTLLPSVRDANQAYAAFYNPSVVGLPAHGIVFNFNRVKIGEAALSSSDYLVSGLPSTPSWVDTLFNQALVGTAQFASGSALGTSAIIGYARTSDFYNYGGVPSQGSQGGAFVAYNDDLVGTNAIADAIFGVAIQRSGGTGLTTLVTQLDINAATPVDIQAYATGGNPNGGYNGETIGALITSGAYSAFATAKPSAAIFVGYGGYKTFRKGIVVGPTALDTTVGAGNGGLFADLPRGVSLRWQNNTPGTDAEIWGDANGFNVNSKSRFNGAPTFILGSDATGDIYYRASTGALSRLGIGSTGNVLTVSGGLPAWTAIGTGVSSVSNSDGTLAISPTTGAVVASLALGHANVWTGFQNFSNGAQITDTSASPGSATTFFNPKYYSVLSGGVGIVDRFNRLLIGTATAQTSDITNTPPYLPTTPTWVDTLLQVGAMGLSQVGTISSIGALAITGASRSSDFRSWAASASKSTIGVTGVGYSNDTGSGTPFVLGVLGEGVRAATVGGNTLGGQFDVCNAGAVVDQTPYSANVGTTYAAGFTAGAYAPAVANTTAAMYIGPAGSLRHRKGILFIESSLDTGVGAGGDGLAMQMARGMSINWANTTPGVDTEIWGDANGFNVNSKSRFVGQETIIRNGIGAATPTPAGDGLLLVNQTAAVSGTQQNSPNIHLAGMGYGGSTSQAADWLITNQPIQGVTNPTSQLLFSSSINGGTYTPVIAFLSNGNVGIGITNPANPFGVYSLSTSQALFYGYDPIGGADSKNGSILLGQNAGFQGSIHYNTGSGLGEFYIDNSQADNGANIYFRTQTAGTAVNALTILGSGNVGIGTTSPGSALTVYGGGVTVGPSSTNAGQGNILLMGDGSSAGGVAAFYYAGTEYARLQAGPSGLSLLVAAGATHSLFAFTSGGVYIGATPADPGANNMTVQGGMEVGAATGGQLGAGKINVAGGIYLNNTAYTNPDYALERYFTGRIERFADKPGAKSYGGLMPLHELETYLRDSLRLPGIGDEPADIFSRADIALEKIEEATLYLLELHNRTAALEARWH